MSRSRPESGEGWAGAAARLDDGASLEDACRTPGVPPDAGSRLGSRWAGAWVDLLDGLDGARVLVVDRSPGRAGLELASRAAVLGFVEPAAERAAFRRAMLAGSRPAFCSATTPRWPPRAGGT